MFRDVFNTFWDFSELLPAAHFTTTVSSHLMSRWWFKTFFFFFKYRQPTTPLWPSASNVSMEGGCVLHRDTSGCSSLSRHKTENNIRMYFSLLLILSVSYSLMTEINERQTCADYFCIFALEISAEKLVTGAATLVSRWTD